MALAGTRSFDTTASLDCGTPAHADWSDRASGAQLQTASRKDWDSAPPHSFCHSYKAYGSSSAGTDRPRALVDGQLTVRAAVRPSVLCKPIVGTAAAHVEDVLDTGAHRPNHVVVAASGASPRPDATSGRGVPSARAAQAIADPRHVHNAVHVAQDGQTAGQDLTVRTKP